MQLSDLEQSAIKLVVANQQPDNAMVTDVYNLFVNYLKENDKYPSKGLKQISYEEYESLFLEFWNSPNNQLARIVSKIVDFGASIVCLIKLRKWGFIRIYDFMLYLVALRIIND